jgi:hypothetical protein
VSRRYCFSRPDRQSLIAQGIPGTMALGDPQARRLRWKCTRVCSFPTLELKAGDMACLPKGAVTTWHLTLPFKEMWVLAG